MVATTISRLNVVNILTYLLNVAVTWGSQLGWFGATNKQQSLKYQTLATPIGFSFAIWGPIFILQAIFAVVQLMPQYRSEPVVVDGVAYWYVVVCAAQAAWTVAFAQDVVWLSMIFMLLILASLGALVRSVTVLAEAAPPSALRYACFRAPFLMHFGWITAASFVNANTCVVAYAGADHSLQLGAAVATLALVLLPGLVNPATTTRACTADPLYSSVIVWAFFGVHSQLSAPLQGGLTAWCPPLVQSALSGVAALMAAGLGAVVLLRLIWRGAAAASVVAGAGGRASAAGAGSHASLDEEGTAPVYPSFVARSESAAARKPREGGL